MHRRALLIEYLLFAGLAALVVAIFLMISIADFQKDRAPDMRDPIGLIGIIAFVHVFLLSGISLALIYLWTLYSPPAQGSLINMPGVLNADGISTTEADPDRSGSPWVRQFMAPYIVSCIFSATLVSALIVPPFDSMSFSKYWFYFVLGMPLAAAPAILMILRRILLLVALPLGRIVSGLAEAVRRRRDAMLAVLDRLLGIRPKP